MIITLFDTETTGLPQRDGSNNTTWPDCVQCSWLTYDVENESIIRVQNHYVCLDKGVHVSQGSTNIHGLTDEYCNVHGIPFKTMIELFEKDCIISDKIIAHNMSFDKSVINNQCKKIGIESPLTNNKLICSMNNRDVIAFCDTWYTHKSGKRVRKFPKLVEFHRKLFSDKPALKEESLHDSFCDVIVLLRCYIQWEYKKDIVNSHDLFRKYYMTSY